MTTNIDLDVPYAFHPGEYLKRALQEENISQKSFAAVLGVSRFEVNLIIKWKRNIKPRLAMRIGEAFGTGPELWINLQTMYDLWLAKQNKEELKELSFIHKRRPLFTPQLEERYLSTIATA